MGLINTGSGFEIEDPLGLFGVPFSFSEQKKQTSPLNIYQEEKEEPSECVEKKSPWDIDPDVPIEDGYCIPDLNSICQDGISTGVPCYATIYVDELPDVGISGILYITKDDDEYTIYEWNGSIFVNVTSPNSCTLQVKSVTPSFSAQTVLPDPGYNGMSEVDVDAVQRGELDEPTIGYIELPGAGVALLRTAAWVAVSGWLDTSDSIYKLFNVHDVVPSQAGTTITPTTSPQLAVAKFKWTTGPVYVAAIPPEYVIPTGTKNITANGNAQDVAAYEKVDVNVPASAVDSGTKSITSNGNGQDVVGYAAVDVNVPASAVDTGTKNIYTNGTHDVTGYASASVAVPASAVDSGTKSITSNGNNQDVVGYAAVNVNVPNTYSAGDEGKVVSSGTLVAQSSATYSTNGTYDTTLKNSVQVAVPASAVDTGSKSISTNGTHDVVGYASAVVNVPASAVDSGTKSITANGNNQDVVGYAAVNVNVPNSYAAGDEGKVVSNGALVSQTSDTVTANDTYDTTLINSLTVNVSGGGTDYLVERCNGTLSSYESDGVTSLAQNCFRDCTTLTSLKVYNCATVGSLCLYNTHIQKLALPSLTSVATQSLSNLGSGYLKELDLGPNCASLNNQGLTNNSALTKIVLRRTSIVALNNVNVFNNTPFKNGGTGGTIYIPKTLYDHLGDNSNLDYRKATNWTTINGYGTITWAKIEGSYYETHYADGTVI